MESPPDSLQRAVGRQVPVFPVVLTVQVLPPGLLSTGGVGFGLTAVLVGPGRAGTLLEVLGVPPMLKG